MTAITPRSPFPAAFASPSGPHRQGGGAPATGTMTAEQSAAEARETINRLPVSSSINQLVDVLSGISLSLGARRIAPASTAGEPPGPQAVNAAAGAGAAPAAAHPNAASAQRHYAAIDASIR